MPPARKARDIYTFTIVKNFPKFRSFEVLKQPESDFVSAFLKTLSQLFKGD